MREKDGTWRLAHPNQAQRHRMNAGIIVDSEMLTVRFKNGRQLGKVEKERGFYTGNSDVFKEVRVEYNYDPINGVYREIGIVREVPEAVGVDDQRSGIPVEQSCEQRFGGRGAPEPGPDDDGIGSFAAVI